MVISVESQVKAQLGGKTKESGIAEVFTDGRRIYKKYRSTPLARALFYRELKNIRALQKFGFIPRLVGASALTIIMEKIDGDFIHHLKAPSIKICDNLAKNVAELHRRWIFHLDLRQRKNFLIAEDNKVSIIDFQSCVILPRCGLLNPLAELLRALDIGGLLRFKSRYFGGHMTRAETLYLKRFNALRRLWFIRPFKKRRRDL